MGDVVCALLTGRRLEITLSNGLLSFLLDKVSPAPLGGVCNIEPNSGCFYSTINANSGGLEASSNFAIHIVPHVMQCLWKLVLHIIPNQAKSRMFTAKSGLVDFIAQRLMLT